MASDLNLSLKIHALVDGIKQVQGLAEEVKRLSGVAGKPVPDATQPLREGAQRTDAVLAGLRRTALQVISVFAGFRALKSFVDAGIEFNAAVEQSRLGIAALITAQANLTDSTGRALTGQEALGAAMQISADQVQKLRIAGIQTAATFEQLAQAFQQAVGAGLASGLDLDQIRNLTVQIVQAAAALGVPMNQVAQEVRSILDGTIDINARVAKALGITNEMVANWRAQGTLADELNKRLAAFTVAGEKTAQTWQAVKSNMADALSTLAGEATEPLFARLKQAALDAMNSIFNTAKGTISETLNGLMELLQRIAGAIGETLGNAMRGIVEGAQNLSTWLAANREHVDKLLTAFGQLFSIMGDLLAAAGKIVGAIAEWLIQSDAVTYSLRTLQLLVAGIQDGFTFIGGVVALVGGKIIDFLATPLQFVLDKLAAAADLVGLNGDTLRQAGEDMKNLGAAAEDYGNQVIASFAAGDTAVKKAIAGWDDLEKQAQRTGQAIDDAVKKTGQSANTKVTPKTSPLSQQAKDQLTQIRAQLLESQGKIAEAQRLTLETQFRELLQQLERAGDKAGIALVKKFINVKAARGELDQLRAEYSQALQQMQTEETDINAQREAGLIGEIEARERIVDLHKRTAAAMEPVIQKMREQADRIRQDMPEAAAAIDQQIVAVQRMGQEINPIAQRVNTAIRQGMTDSIYEFIRGTKSAKEAFQDFASSVVAALERIAAKKLAESIFTGLNLGSIGNFFSALVSHSGGVVGAGGGTMRMVSPLAFIGAPRYHSGGIAGLAPDEVPAILQRGEVVLPRGTTGGGSKNVNITIENKGTPQQITDSQVRFDPEAMVIKIIIDDAHRGGPASTTLARTFGLRRQGG